MQNAKSGYQKRGRTDGDPINCFFYFFRANTFYIGLKIMFLKMLKKEIYFLSNYDYCC